jgi:superfamily I DNA/RNA helicase
MPYRVLDDSVETTTGRASISTMHLAKGLEFRTVVVMACDDEIVPLQERIETVADDADSRRSVQYRTPSALRRLHPRPGSPAGHRRRTCIGVSR